ncbi:MAG: hypothetical protein U0K71_11550 [Paludibacteraceae bacterium]|nr:hypothetical protein [Paludibacteraceae bacterium]
MDNNLYEKLTDSAKKELENSTKEIYELLIYKAYLMAEKKNMEDKISLHDILSAKNQILLNDYKYIETKKVNSKKRTMLLFSMAGIIYAIAGISLYLFQNYSFDEKSIGLAIAAFGIMISIFSIFSYKIARINETTIKSHDKFDKSLYDFVITNKWQTIEKLGMDLMVKKGIVDRKSISINQIVEFLYNNISEISVDDLKLLLTTRNNLVHKGIILSKENFESTLSIADRIIYALKHKLEE